MRDFALEVFLSEWEFTAKYHMTASDIESMTISELLALDPEVGVEVGGSAFPLGELWLGYTESYGAMDLREEIARTYESASPSDVLCFAGAEEGIYAAMRVLLDKDDHAVVVVPNYQASETIPLDICAVTGVALDPEEGWQLDIDRVREALRPDTKLVSINFPNNPTGSVLERGRFDELVGLCRERGLYLFSDEVYRLIERDESIRLPQVGDIYERGLSLNVMSKAYGLPGLRIGWIMSRDRDVLQRMERYKHYLSICNSAPSEYLAAAALRGGRREKILARNRALVERNVGILEDFFLDYPDFFEWKRPDGGVVGFPRYKGSEGADRFCADLLKKSGVLLLPPAMYQSELMETPADRFRIGFGRKIVEAGIIAMREYMEGVC